MIAAAVPIAGSVAGLVMAVVRNELTSSLPIGLGAVALYSTLGVFLFHGRSWARWILFALIALTAGVCGLFSLDAQGMSPRDALLLRGVALIYVSAAVLLAWTNQKELRQTAQSQPG